MLQCRTGKQRRVGEVGIAGAEVIDRNPDTKGLEASQNANALFWIFHGQLFSDFEFQLLRHKAVLEESPRYQ